MQPPLSASKRKRPPNDDAAAAAAQHPRRAGGAPLPEAAVRQVAAFYNSRENQSHQQREASTIIHLKKLNNWVKSVLIQTYVRPGAAVLDLACGKFGDLIKWEKAHVGYLVGIDIASGSVEDARMRYNGEGSQDRRQLPSFPARLICGDCWKVSLMEHLKMDTPFDAISCQFAFHYSFETEARARQALKNVSDLLRPGGIFFGTLPDANVIVRKLRQAQVLDFGNRVYAISFSEHYMLKQFPAVNPFGLEYNFHLEDAVDCPEWLVPFDVLVSLAAEYGLHLRLRENFHDFIIRNSEVPDFGNLMLKILGARWSESISEDEWDAAHLYLVFAFSKQGEDKARESGELNHHEERISHKEAVSAHGQLNRSTPKRIEPEDIVHI
eukprot:SM000214S06796  [mRNA]  locus=s214:112275:115008:- [translate_table: standard]